MNLVRDLKLIIFFEVLWAFQQLLAVEKKLRSDL